MKFCAKIVSIILCFAVILSLPINTMAEDFSLQIIDITNNNANVYITCKMVGTINNKLTLICKGEDNSVLYIGEYPVMNYGYFELSFPISNNYTSQIYTVSIGGNDFNTPLSQSFYIDDNSSPQYIVIKDNQTVKELKDIFKNNNAQFYRNGTLLSDTDVVKSIDTISLFNGSASVNRQAIILGDVDLSGNINTTDALCILHQVVGKISLNKPSLLASDVLHDGNVTTSSALQILNYIIGKITEF